MKKGTPGESVMWGADDYNAAQDAIGWLSNLGRAGGQVTHEDNDALVTSVADRLIDLPFITWNFGDSVAFEALIAASEHLGDEKWSRFAHGWGRAWASRANPHARLDCTAPGHALVGLARRYGDERLLKACIDLGEYLTSRPTLDGVYETWEKSPLLLPYGGVALSDRGRRLLGDPPAGVFLDCLHFDPPFFAALGAATGDPRWIGEAVDQALGYVRLLQSPSGLFDHFVLRGEPGSFGPGWGRGQGWAVLGLLDVIEILDEVGAREEGEWHDARTQLVRALNLLIEAMLKLQRDDGHWYAVVDDPESGDEFSTSAFMVSAFARAMRLRLAEGSGVAASARRARRAVMGSLDSAGQLREVSAAVYASTESGHYGKVPRGFVVPWGQGPTVLALVERELNA